VTLGGTDLGRGCTTETPIPLYIERMTSLSEASLSVDERVLLERFVEDLHRRLEGDLHAVWLFGSRARGERGGEESDVDVLVLVADASWDGKMRVRETLDMASRELGLQPLTWSFSIHVNTPAWLEQRRRIGSFFIAEVDRDKIPLCEPA
jgi:predicted nucleotidyltransferase